MRLLLATRGGTSTPPPPSGDLPYSTAFPTRASYGSRITTLSPGQSINDAVAAAAASLAPAPQRALVVVTPGVYVDRVSASPRVDIVGATGNPADVEVRADGAADPGRWSPLNESPGLVGGITWRLLSSTTPGSGQYALHLTATPSQMTLFEKCNFISEAPDRNTAVGADVAPGSKVYFLGCNLTQQVASNNALQATNFHGTVTGAGAQIVFLDCTANGASGWNDLDNGTPDHYWWVGGSLPYWLGHGANTTMHLDPTTVGGTYGPAFTGTVIRSTDRPSLPVRGVAP